MGVYLFPIETTARELDFKILMASKVAKSGSKVIIGDQQYIRILSFLLKGGVFFGKHLFGKPKFSDTDYFNRLKKRRFNVCHLNEEGAVWPGDEKTWENLMINSERPSVLHASDVLMTWGDWQKRFNLSYEEPVASITTTGHPRFDLYRDKYRHYFKEETDKLKEKYGNFLLVNTSFSYSNNGEGGAEFIFKKTLSYNAKDSNHRRYRFGRWYNQMVSMASIVKLINELSIRFPNKKIVLRPHPSEDTHYYEAIFQDIENVKIIYSGPVSQWIMASELLIHNGCTTAIEATLAGKPVINFAPAISDDTANVYLANVCGKSLSQIDDVVGYVRQIESGNVKVDVPEQELANDLFFNFQEESTSDSVSMILEQSMPSTDKSDRDINKGIFVLSVVVFYIYLAFKRVYYFTRGENKKYVDYRKRFERLARPDIEKKLNLMCSINSKKLRMSSFFAHGFVVESREK